MGSHSVTCHPTLVNAPHLNHGLAFSSSHMQWAIQPQSSEAAFEHDKMFLTNKMFFNVFTVVFEWRNTASDCQSFLASGSFAPLILWPRVLALDIAEGSVESYPQISIINSHYHSPHSLCQLLDPLLSGILCFVGPLRLHSHRHEHECEFDSGLRFTNKITIFHCIVNNFINCARLAENNSTMT